MFIENLPIEERKTGWIEVICGSMFSGKTEELIRRIKRVQFANQSLLLVKPQVDNRYHKEDVVSHQGTSFHAICISSANEIMESWKGESVVAIDEAQFFSDDLVDICTTLAKQGVRVILAGLDMDFQGHPFGPMPKLLCVAEYVTKVHAICLDCGGLAQFSHRTVEQKEQVLVGAVDHYKPLCRSCYNNAAKK